MAQPHRRELPLFYLCFAELALFKPISRDGLEIGNSKAWQFGKWSHFGSRCRAE